MEGQHKEKGPVEAPNPTLICYSYGVVVVVVDDVVVVAHTTSDSTSLPGSPMDALSKMCPPVTKKCWTFRRTFVETIVVEVPSKVTVKMPGVCSPPVWLLTKCHVPTSPDPHQVPTCGVCRGTAPTGIVKANITAIKARATVSAPSLLLIFLASHA